MSKRIAANAVPLRWQGIDFSSFKALDTHIGKSIGYSRSYWVKGIDLYGYPIIRDGKITQYIPQTRRKINRKWTDKKMIEFATFILVRKTERSELGLPKMLEKFKATRK